ncbi:hypothetical protein CHUAL_003876, partial [Chamberlinius hualienensis]
RKCTVSFGQTELDEYELAGFKSAQVKRLVNMQVSWIVETAVSVCFFFSLLAYGCLDGHSCMLLFGHLTTKRIEPIINLRQTHEDGDFIH